MFLKAHLTSYFRISSSRWVTIPSWLSESFKPFFGIVFLCILATSSQSLLLLLNPSHSVISSTHPCRRMKYSHDSPNFLKESLVFLILLSSSVALHCWFKKTFLSFFAFLCKSIFGWVCLSLSLLPFTFLLSSSFVKPPKNYFASYVSLSLGQFSSLPPVQH